MRCRERFPRETRHGGRKRLSSAHDDRGLDSFVRIDGGDSRRAGHWHPATTFNGFSSIHTVTRFSLLRMMCEERRPQQSRRSPQDNVGRDLWTAVATKSYA